MRVMVGVSTINGDGRRCLRVGNSAESRECRKEKTDGGETPRLGQVYVPLTTGEGSRHRARSRASGGASGNIN